MGYNTKFSGAINLSRKLTFSEAKTILDVADDSNIAEGVHPKRYLQWVPTIELDSIVYDEYDKFYDYIEWMEWILFFMKSLGINTNGVIRWAGENSDDVGIMTVEEGKLTVSRGIKSSPSGKPLTMNYLARMALEEWVKS